MSKQNKRPEPKFKIGDRVSFKEPREPRREGIVEGVHRMFKKMLPGSDAFEPGGLVTEERMIESIVLPYTFDGETLTIDYPEADYGTWIQKAHTDRSRFYGYSCSVRSGKDFILFPERALTKV